MAESRVETEVGRLHRRGEGGPVDDEGDADSIQVNPAGSQGTSSSSRNPSPRNTVHRQVVTRSLAHRARHPSQKPQDQALNSTTEDLKLDDNRFRGLTPPPIVAHLTARRKRALEEVIEDTTPPEKDKLSKELEKLTTGEVSSADDEDDEEDGDQEPDEENSDGEYILAGKSTGGPSTRAIVGNDRNPRKRVKLRPVAPKKSEAPAEPGDTNVPRGEQ